MPLYNVTLYPTVILRFAKIEAASPEAAAEIAETQYADDPDWAIRARMNAPSNANDWIEIDASEPRVDGQPLVDEIDKDGNLVHEDMLNT